LGGFIIFLLVFVVGRGLPSAVVFFGLFFGGAIEIAQGGFPSCIQVDMALNAPFPIVAGCQVALMSTIPGEAF